MQAGSHRPMPPAPPVPVIVDAVRTPVGRYNGILRDVRPDDLAAHVIRELVRRSGIDPSLIEDVIFGAANLNLKIAEVPINYASRRYGETQISRFRHGWLLLRMVVFAFRKFKAF